MNSDKKRAFEPRLNEEKLINSVQYLKLTLPKMREFNIPVTPENYAIWYQYSSNQIPELNNAINALLDQKSGFTEQINKDLYDTYVKEKSDSTLLTGIQSATENLLIRLMSELDSMKDDTERFSNALEEGAKSLESDVSVEVLALLVNRLNSELEEVKQSNTIMESAVKSMTKEVMGLRTEMEKLQIAVTEDALTGLLNRRAFDDILQELTNDAAATGDVFSLLMVDIDHFKKFNDTYGHISGDKALIYVATLMKKGVKGTDYVARFGGEEFAILLPKATYSGAMVVANQLCHSISSKILVAGSVDKKSLGKITISIGVAEFSVNDVNRTLIERADTALYTAKKLGRNQVTGENDIG